MEEPATWKGHSFTLLVFGGIVVLCSIFFILGMLVGRDQGQRIAETAAVAEASQKESAEASPETSRLNFYAETTEPKPELSLQPASDVPPEPAASEPPPPDESSGEKKEFLQIFATKDSREANRVLEKVKSENFQAIILPPGPGDKDAWYRVQVGPYDSVAEADLAEKDLQSRGYKSVLRR